jgi:two-component system, chemotaxis family, protein-glutamate methylesterase/glutaminase
MPRFPIRVLVVDDSAYIRKVFSEILMQNPRLEVVGTAYNGRDALEKVVALNPDVITLDLFMDELDGVGFIREQMARKPLPIIICSVADEDGNEAVSAMEAGAVEFVRKPTALALDQVYEIDEELVQKVITAATIPMDKLAFPQTEAVVPVVIKDKSVRRIDALMMGTSTGGPNALRSLLPRFPANFPVPVAIVIHMPEGYTGPLAKKLNEISALEVVEAEEGMEMVVGRIVLAKAGFHLVLRKREDFVVAHLDRMPENLPHRPAVDELFRSAAEIYGERTLGVVMTGMGNDGTTGAAWIKSQGGIILTEDETSCVVYGMPRSVVEAGLSDQSVPLEGIAEAIMEII